MLNRRGQFFSLYLVALTLFMCGVVIWMYVVGQGNLDSSLVSPKAVLDVRDGLEIFEMREMELIKSSVKGVDGEFGSDEFLNLFHKNFINGVMADEEMREFIFSVSSINEVRVAMAHRDKRDFFENVVYLKAKFVGGKISFSRVKMKKDVPLLAEDRKNKNNFPVDFGFEFEREYLIDKDGSIVKI